MVRLRILAVFAAFLFLSNACLSWAQENNPSVFVGNQEVRVANLPSLTAASSSRSAAMATALEIVLHDKTVCCGKDSALADSLAYVSLSHPASLKELGAKLQGKHLTDDDQPILVDAEYVAEKSITGDAIVRALLGQHAMLVEWKSRLYVLYGALYNEYSDQNGGLEFSVLKLYLIDPRFSDQRREVVFDRQTEDLGTVEGMLGVTVTVPPSRWK